MNGDFSIRPLDPVGASPVGCTRFPIWPDKETKKVRRMSRSCELTNKSVMTGNNVSHAKNRNKRRFLPNLCHVTLQSEAMGQSYRMRISAHALRSVEHRGGLDAFLAKASDNELSQRARLLKKQISKKLAEQATA